MTNARHVGDSVVRHSVPARDEVGPDTPLRLADAARIAEIPILRTDSVDEDAREFEITIEVPLNGGGGGMKTSFLLMAQYDGLAVIPVEWVCRDYFRHLTVEKFLRKVLVGEISLPIVRIESSQKSAKGIHINDLAAYLDKQADAARKECEQLKRSA